MATGAVTAATRPATFAHRWLTCDPHGKQLTSKSRISHDQITTPQVRRIATAHAALHRPVARLGRESKGGRRRQRSPPVGRYRVQHQRDVATPAVTAGFHRPQHAVQHRDQPRQIVSYQVGPDDTGLLAAIGELGECLVQRGRNVGSQRPNSRAAVNRLCSRAPSDIAASISWARPTSGSAAPRTASIVGVRSSAMH